MKFVDKVSTARELIERYSHENVALACSFGKDSMVVLHIARKVNLRFPVFSVMTPFKFKETFDYKDYMTELWQLNIKTYMESLAVPGHNLYATDPDACCQRYKVEPTRRAIQELGLNVWITGLRRTEGRTRTNYEYVEVRDGLVKVNPILDFTETDVWRYLAMNNIPVHPLYERGYRSLGCAPCSKVEEEENETERAGRWSGTSKCGGECGIHTQSLR